MKPGTKSGTPTGVPGIDRERIALSQTTKERGA